MNRLRLDQFPSGVLVYFPSGASTMVAHADDEAVPMVPSN
jgi:hypothetical protein